MVMSLPFVGDGATNLDGFFSQRETGGNHAFPLRLMAPFIGPAIMQGIDHECR